MKLSLLFTSLCCLFLINNGVIAQICNEPPVTAIALSGNLNTPTLVEVNTLFSDINYTNPSNDLLNVEFLIVNKSISTTDGIRGVIVGVSPTGAFQPSDYGISICDEFSITPISYNLSQIQTLVQAILTQSYMPAMSCCTTIQMLGSNLCSDLADMGITEGSDIQSISDLFSMMQILTGSNTVLTLNSVVTTIAMLNSMLPSLGDCNGGISALCYAMDTISNDHYVIRGAELISFEVSETAVVWYPMQVAAYPIPVLSAYQTVNNGEPCSNDFIYTSLSPNQLEIISNNGNFKVMQEGIFGIEVCHRYETHLPCDTIWVEAVYHEPVVAVEDLNFSINPIVYPNPTQEQIMLSFEQSTHYNNYLITISDLAGRVVYNKNLVAQEGEVNLPINVGFLANGMYILTLSNASVKVARKIMKH